MITSGPEQQQQSLRYISHYKLPISPDKADRRNVAARRFLVQCEHKLKAQ